jgi:DNA-directed RNA polymerase specialized sigma24 family protein
MRLHRSKANLDRFGTAELTYAEHGATQSTLPPGYHHVHRHEQTSVIAGSRLDLLDALERLEAYRPELVTPMVLRDICQLDYDDIATQLGVPVGTVKSRIHYARVHVRRSLAVGPNSPG